MKKKYYTLLIILITFYCIPCISQVNLNSGLVAYYPFNGNANDASGNANNASFNNATLTTDRFGNPNSAYYFNGVNNYIEIPNSSTLNPTQISLCAIVKPMGFYYGSCHGNSVLSKGNDGANIQGSYRIRFDDNPYTIGQNCANAVIDSLHQNFYSDFGGNGILSTPYSPYVQKDTWFCIVYTYDGANTKFYVNGALKFASASSTPYIPTTDDLFFGKLNSALFPYWFNGVLDEVRIYNRAINASEAIAVCSLCNQPQGSLVGDSICSPNTGTLTFNATVGSPPFTIQYTDGTNKYVQTNVTSGIPFPVAVNPTTTTTYTLDSIADATSCSRTTGFVAGTVQIVVKNCLLQNCTDWLNIHTNNDAVIIGDLDVPGTTITVEAQVNPALYNPLWGQDVVSKHSDPTDVNYLLRLKQAGVTTTNGYFATAPFCADSINKTYHIAMVYDGSTLKYYRNGFLMNFVPCTGNMIQNNWNTTIGNYAAVLGEDVEAMWGYINEVRIWNVARTQSQIRTYMNTSLPNPATQLGLLAYYQFSDLLNKQGNPAWNGTLAGAALINQTNPTCAGFVADSCCPVLNGSIKGSPICKGSQASLTFSTSSTTGPFTITYTDGTNIFTQDSVQNNTTITVPNAPATTTNYILLSVKDTTSCGATTIIGETATVIVNNCSLCKGSLGDPVVNITFGGGANPGQPLATIVPGASTTMTYVAVAGNPASPTPVDGQYTITNNVPFNADWFSGAYDHTSNNGTGYMAFYNATELPGEFYSQTVNNLCGSTTYEFAAWIANVLNPAAVIGVDPNITFNIEQTDGTVLATFSTGDIPQNNIFTWTQYGFYFTTPANVSTVVLKMINNSPGGVAHLGNDLAIDDITFRPCGPLITASFNLATIVDSQSVCKGKNITLYGTASNGYASPAYLWQFSADSGNSWVDIPNSNMLQISLAAPLTGMARNYKYRMLSGEGNNINSLNCRVSSNLTILNVKAGPDGKLSSQGVCPGNNANLIFNSTSTNPPFSITWTDGTNSFIENNLNNNSAFLTTFAVNNNSTYNLHSVADANGCTNTLDSIFSIPVFPLPHAYLKGSTICNGDSAAVQFTATSGASPFNIGYSSSGNSYTQIGLSKISTFNIPYLLTDTTVFTLTLVTDANGCTAIADTATTVNVNPLPQGGITGSTACSGDSAGITFNASRDLGPFKLEISDGTNSTIYYDIQSGVPFKIAPLKGTTNILLISIIDQNGTGCTRTNGFTSPNATISVIPSPVIKFDSLAPICIQQSAFPITQAKEITGLAGSGSFSGQGVDPRGNFSPASAGVGAHTIIYTYRANNGCSSSDSSSVVVNPTPAVSAGPDLITCMGFPVQLNATGGATYLWSPVTGLDNPGKANPVTTIDSTTTYIVLGTDSNGCFASDTVTVNVGKNGIAAFVVPNAFTPNGDGRNDCFGINRWGPVTIVEFSIFNRWGQLVFSTKNSSDCWDGTYQGKQQDTGGYPYIIKVKSPCGVITRTGIVMLVR